MLDAAVEGDLTLRIESDRFSGFLRGIGENMNRLLDSVAESFGSVKMAIDQVGQAATQLLTTSQLMSSSSVQLNQAADESSGALGKVAQGVRANADNAAMANQLVTQTSSAAQSGQGRMEEMSTAMSAINTSAQQIAKIIKVIDEIAFQTNILALNAAVEAARAGEAGMGFAVVADEVRNLAQRCAQAARDTSTLIADSIAKSNEGKTKVDEVAGAVRTITEESSKVKVLVDEVSLGSEEQTRGIEQVSKAITQMEQVTQRSAASAEEGAAAAEELNAQSATMRDLVGRLAALAGTEVHGKAVPSRGNPGGGRAGRLPLAVRPAAVAVPSEGNAWSQAASSIPMDEFEEMR